jgi:hypothetical protein
MDASDFGIDLDVILNAVDQAEVLIIRFPVIDKRLLVDLRPSPYDPPVVTLVPQASAIEDRFRSVLKARPALPAPERIVSFQWPRQAETLAAAGVWDRLVARAKQSGHDDAGPRCDAAWKSLLAEERREVVAAIRGGERYQTMWQRG